jgi:hypothetical protein
MSTRSLLCVLIGLAIVSRLIPHPPNFVFLGALGLFAGSQIRGAWGFLAPLVALAISDVVGHYAGVPGMGFYHPWLMLAVYAGVAISGVLGLALGQRPSAVGLVGASLVSSTLFFVISNFGVWATGSYPANLSGLAACYAAAVPFFQYTLAGDLVYTALTFGTLAVCRHGEVGFTLRRLAPVPVRSK